MAQVLLYSQTFLCWLSSIWSLRFRLNQSNFGFILKDTCFINVIFVHCHKILYTNIYSGNFVYYFIFQIYPQNMRAYFMIPRPAMTIQMQKVINYVLTQALQEGFSLEINGKVKFYFSPVWFCKYILQWSFRLQFAGWLAISHFLNIVLIKHLPVQVTRVFLDIR